MVQDVLMSVQTQGQTGFQTAQDSQPPAQETSHPLDHPLHPAVQQRWIFILAIPSHSLQTPPLHPLSSRHPQFFLPLPSRQWRNEGGGSHPRAQLKRGARNWVRGYKIGRRKIKNENKDVTTQSWVTPLLLDPSHSLFSPPWSLSLTCDKMMPQYCLSSAVAAIIGTWLYMKGGG